MSFPLFKGEMLGQLVPQHSSKTKQSRIFATAYNNVARRHHEVMTGGGTVTLGGIKVPIMTGLAQSIFSFNRISQFKKFNFFSQLAPVVYSYWMGQVIVGPLGIVNVTYPGLLVGPAIPETDSFSTWLNMLCAVLAAHMMTLAGTYTNFYTKKTHPWSGAMLLPCPIK